jgi:hypothetical protein
MPIFLRCLGRVVGSAGAGACVSQAASVRFIVRRAPRRFVRRLAVRSRLEPVESRRVITAAWPGKHVINVERHTRRICIADPQDGFRQQRSKKPRSIRGPRM